MRFLGMVQFAKADFNEALQSVQTAIDVCSRLVEVESNRPGFHLRLATMHDVMADCQFALGNFDECKRHAQKHISEIEAGIEQGGPSYAVQRYAIAEGYFMVAGAELRQNDLEASADALKAAATALESIIELYNTREVYKTVDYAAQLIAGLAGRSHSADPLDVAMLTRGFNACQALSAGDDSIFRQNEQQMKDDIQTVTQPVTRSMLCEQMAVCYALQYSQLLDAIDTKPFEVQQAESRCIEAILQCQATDPLAHVRQPEFLKLQSTAAFQEAFPLK